MQTAEAQDVVMRMAKSYRQKMRRNSISVEPRDVERRAIPLGLRGDVLARYAREWLLGIEDLSTFVAEQRSNARAPYEELVTPREDVYPVADSEVAGRLGVSTTGED